MFSLMGLCCCWTCLFKMEFIRKIERSRLILYSVEWPYARDTPNLPSITLDRVVRPLGPVHPIRSSDPYRIIRGITVKNKWVNNALCKSGNSRLKQRVDRGVNE